MLNELDAERSFNMIDNIYVEEALRDAQLQGNLVLIRAKLNNIYGRDKSNSADDDSPIEYTQHNENGFKGLEAPLG